MQQKCKRWCRHLQRLCGTKQIWEVLAFFGRFDVGRLLEALHAEATNETAEPPAHDEVSQQNRLRLHHQKAEAIAVHREEVQRCGASQPAYTRRQMQVLENLDSGGSTGGVSRRIIDSWQPPDFREFLEDEQEDRIP